MVLLALQRCALSLEIVGVCRRIDIRLSLRHSCIYVLPSTKRHSWFPFWQSRSNSKRSFFYRRFCRRSDSFCCRLLFLSPRARLRGFAAIAFIFSIISGALGILAWSLGHSLGLILWKVLGSIHMVSAYSANMAGSTNGQFYSLFVVWQTGMAVLLGVALKNQTAPVSAEE